MAFRLWRKAVLMTLREKKTFVIFTLIYTSLIFLTSFFIETTLYADDGGGFSSYFIIIFFVVSIGLSLLYAWIIVSRNKRTWAIFKCIGYTSRNINSIVTGIILFTTFIGFIIVVEALFHYAAVMAYLQNEQLLLTLPSILITLVPVVLTFLLFLIVQVLAIILANRKILKVRPIIALKKPGE